MKKETGNVNRRRTESLEVPSLLWCPASRSVQLYAFVNSVFSVHLSTFSCQFQDSISLLSVLGTA